MKLPGALAAVAALLGVAGCWRTLGVDAADYDLYRRTRTAPTEEERLAAAEQYLRERPRGEYAPEVRAAIGRDEPGFWERSHGTRRGLETYLETLPYGPHAEEAAERLAELDLRRRYARRRAADLDEAALELTERLEDAAESRRAFLREVTAWSVRLASIRSWGARTAELDRSFLHAWRIAEPAARCRDATCTKSLSLVYAVPDGGRLRAHRAVFDVQLELERGLLARGRLTGPELWTRLAEAVEVARVPPGDAQARAEAIGRSVDVVKNAIEAHLPAARCEREAVGMRVLVRSCDGVSLTMVAAESPEEEDRLEVAPVAVPH
ncbi:MAG: hypothetical protein IT376_17100 [Polyangiaceae bacterium]|nr:hypothetical protein [Polyangiaceae bacterium]